jgi:hypothetical protein
MYYLFMTQQLVIFNFMALTEVVRENLLHTFEVLYEGRM